MHGIQSDLWIHRANMDDRIRSERLAILLSDFIQTTVCSLDNVRQSLQR